MWSTQAPCTRRFPVAFASEGRWPRHTAALEPSSSPMHRFTDVPVCLPAADSTTTKLCFQRRILGECRLPRPRVSMASVAVARAATPAPSLLTGESGVGFRLVFAARNPPLWLPCAATASTDCCASGIGGRCCGRGLVSCVRSFVGATGGFGHGLRAPRGATCRQSRSCVAAIEPIALVGPHWDFWPGKPRRSS